MLVETVVRDGVLGSSVKRVNCSEGARWLQLSGEGFSQLQRRTDETGRKVAGQVRMGGHGRAVVPAHLSHD